MAPISIPSAGLPLSGFPTVEKEMKKHAQAIKIMSAGNDSMEQIISKVRSGAEVMVSLGKKPVLFIDKQVYHVQTHYHPQALLFKQEADSAQLQLSARLNLRDAQARLEMNVPRDIDFNDPSIAALQQNYAKAKEEKDANKAIFVKDSSKLPPAKGGRSALLKAHRVGMFGGGHGNSTTKSLPTSPSLGGVTPQPGQRDAKLLKQEAIKRALIHLLAVRAVSEKYIVSELKCDPADAKPLLEKYGRESNFDKTKFNLSERGYKELDVWAFSYAREDDRQGAIDRAIAAYDRQRVSIVDPLWQKLLPKTERGKGKVLSKLGNLHGGPIAQVRTPRINVESATAAGEVGDKDKQSEEERMGRLAPSDAQVRSRSQDPVTKKKISEREAQSKRLFAKDPKKAAERANAKAKAAAEAAEKKAAKKVAPKKAQAKNASASSSKIKSAEYVRDSDEDIELDEAPSQPPGLKRRAEDEGQKDVPAKKPKEEPKPTAKPVQEKKATETKRNERVPDKKALERKTTEKKVPEKKPLEKTTQKIVEKRTQKGADRATANQRDLGKETEKKDAAARPDSKLEKEKPTSKPLPGVGVKKPQTDSKPMGLSTSTKPRIPESQRPVAMARTLSHKRSGSSPVKPSPLGSSPPTNASDFEHEQILKAASSKSSSSSGSPLINQRRERLEAQKNAARATEITESPAVSGDSARPLKRRANDLDADVHQHGGVSAPTNGANAAQTPRAAKRPRLPESPPATSPESDKPANSNSSSDLSPAPVEHVSPSKSDLDYARSFKVQWARYHTLLRELQALADPPDERVEKLQRMHAKLVKHKEQLWKMAGGSK